jgi:hypothetical protein
VKQLNSIISNHHATPLTWAFFLHTRLWSIVESIMIFTSFCSAFFIKPNKDSSKTLVSIARYGEPSIKRNLNCFHSSFSTVLYVYKLGSHTYQLNTPAAALSLSPWLIFLFLSDTKSRWANWHSARGELLVEKRFRVFKFSIQSVISLDEATHVEAFAVVTGLRGDNLSFKWKRWVIN